MKLLYFLVMELNFRQNLRAELDYRDLTVKELSAKTGIPKGTLDCYLGIRASMPPADIAVKIAHALGVSVEYLVTGEDEKPCFLNSQITRSIVEILPELNERDHETILGLARLLKKQSGKL